MSEVIAWLNKPLPENSILTCGTGNYTDWVHPLLGPTNGSIGYGVPAEVADKRAYPQRTVVASAGDGYFLMNGQELATAVHYKHPANRCGGKQWHIQHQEPVTS